MPFDGDGDEPDGDRLGDFTIATVLVGAATGVVGGGEAVGGAGVGRGVGAGDGEGAGAGTGRGFGRDCGRERSLAGAAGPEATRGRARGPPKTGVTGPVDARARPDLRDRPTTGENDDNTERCCVAGTPAPAADGD